MATINDKRITRKWRRIFRVLFSIIAISLVVTFFPLNDEVEIVLASIGFLAGLTGMVFLWFLYNNPEKFNMQEEIENDI